MESAEILIVPSKCSSMPLPRRPSPKKCASSSFRYSSNIAKETREILEAFLLQDFEQRKATLRLSKVLEENDSGVLSRTESVDLQSRRASLYLKLETVDDCLPNSSGTVEKDFSPVDSVPSAASVSTDAEESSTSGQRKKFPVRAKKTRFKLIRERLERTFKRTNTKKSKIINRHTFNVTEEWDVKDSAKNGKLLNRYTFSNILTTNKPHSRDKTGADFRLNRSASDSAHKGNAVTHIGKKTVVRKESLIDRVSGALRHLRRSPSQKRKSSLGKLSDLAHRGSKSGLQDLISGTDSAAGIIHKNTNIEGFPSENDHFLIRTDHDITNGSGVFEGNNNNNGPEDEIPMIDSDENVLEYGVDREEVLEAIAHRLAKIGNEFMMDHKSADDEKLTDLEQEVCKVIMRKGDQLAAKYENPSVFEALANSNSSERFSQLILDALPKDDVLTQIALTFRLTSFAIRFAGAGTVAGRTIKDYCTSFISSNFAPWIAQQGGWVSAVEDSSCSDLD